MNHENLRCYNLLIEIAKEVPTLRAKISSGNNYIMDQFVRSLSSAVLNLTEGNGRNSSKEKARFFDISLGSITESSSALDIMEAFHLIPRQISMELKGKLKAAYAMIINLKKSLI